MALPNLDITANTFDIGFFVSSVNNAISAINVINANTVNANNIAGLEASKATNTYVNTLANTIAANTAALLANGLSFKVNISDYTGSDILSKLITVDGTGSGLDSDLLDGFDSSYFLNATNMNQGTLGSARLTGSYTGVQNLTASGNLNSLVINVTNGNISGTLVAANISGNGSNITSVNAANLGGNPPSYYANANPAFSSLTGTANVVQTHLGGTFTKPIRSSFTNLTDGATITIDLSSSNFYAVTIVGARAFANPTGMANSIGQEIALYIAQDATGSRTATFGSYWKFPNGTAPILSTTPGAIDLVVGTVYSATQILCGSVINKVSG